MIRKAVTPHHADKEAYLAETMFFMQLDQSQGFAEVAARLAESSRIGMEEAKRNLATFYNNRVAERTDLTIATGGTAFSVADREKLGTAVFHAIVPPELKSYIRRPVLQPNTETPSASPDWQRFAGNFANAPELDLTILGNFFVIKNLDAAIAQIDQNAVTDFNGTVQNLAVAIPLDGRASPAINKLLAQPRADEGQVLNAKNRSALATQEPSQVAYAAQAMVTSIIGRPAQDDIFVISVIERLKAKPEEGKRLISTLDSLAVDREGHDATAHFVDGVVVKIDGKRDLGTGLGDAISAFEIWEQRRDDADRLRMFELLRTASLAGFVTGVSDRPARVGGDGMRTEQIGDFESGMNVRSASDPAARSRIGGDQRPGSLVTGGLETAIRIGETARK
jgi:hypothetical protein